MKMNFLLLIVIIVSVNINSAAQQSVNPVQKTEIAAASYGIVVDNSNSLRYALDAVIQTTQNLVARNNSNDETFLVRFINRDKIQRLQDFTQDPQKISDAAENFYTEGGQTAIIDALYQSAQYLAENNKADSPNRRLALILISDGEERESRRKYEELAKLLSEKKITVYTIGFSKQIQKDQGRKTYEKAAAFLQKLAAETGGKSYFPETAVDLNNAASEIFAELRKQ
jgi:VWFA-related protein